GVVRPLRVRPLQRPRRVQGRGRGVAVLAYVVDGVRTRAATEAGGDLVPLALRIAVTGEIDRTDIALAQRRGERLSGFVGRRIGRILAACGERCRCEQTRREGQPTATWWTDAHYWLLRLRWTAPSQPGAADGPQ